MILLTNGCSWTWGGGLNLDSPIFQEKRKESVWPNHLGQLLNVEKTVNLSIGCGSHHRILRTTLDYILTTPPEDLSKTIAIIQWTEPSRFEYYQPRNINDVYENYPNRWVRAKVNNIIDPYETDKIRLENRLNSRLETYTEIEGLYNHIFECAALHQFFNKYNIRYYYWKYYPYIGNYPENLMSVLNSFNWFKNSENWEYDRVSSNDPHPSFHGHKDIANIIYKLLMDDL